MQTRTQTVVAALMALTTVAKGHITMKSPVPFGSIGPNKKLTNSPLLANNYPCQVDSNPASFYSKEGIDNKMEIGKTQTISFDGSAVHGGGSCQLALTTDPQPSASTSWQVILSIEGGCPSKTGNGADTYDFTIPDSIKAGDYVFAWTWISKLSGQPEFYMNCAPVTITGGSGKRSYDNETMELFSRDDALPELTVANIAGFNDCKAEPNTDPLWPNPGPNVIKPGSQSKFAPISGTNCVPKGAKAVTPGAGSSSGSVPSGSGTSPDVSSVPAAPDTPSSGGGVFVTTPVGGASSASAATSSTPAAASTSTAASAATTATYTDVPTTLSTVVTSASASASASSSSAAEPASSTDAAGSSSAPASSAPASSAPASTPSGSPTGGSGSGTAQGLTGPCTSEGMFNCVGGTSYQQCASGSWSVMMQMPPTTKCAEGQTMTLWARDQKRASSSSSSDPRRRRGY
ncbi:hypothetical protein F5Y17DRAFT_439729 [Xylariaceae sp. FL0594]|nr:hypothetical protein F5Y17DRAFT_439729 [Xylariaceae sp. FL0594]